MIQQFEFAEQVVNGIGFNEQDCIKMGTANAEQLKEWLALITLEEQCLRLEKQSGQLATTSMRLELEHQQLDLALRKLKNTEQQNHQLLHELSQKGISRKGKTALEHDQWVVDCKLSTMEAHIKLVDEVSRDKYYRDDHLVRHLLSDH